MTAIFKKIILSLVFTVMTFLAATQINLEGYIYEVGNRGFLSRAEVSVLDAESNDILQTTISDQNGHYKLEVSRPGEYLIYILQEPFFESVESFTVEEGSSETLFFKHELERKPGYIFEITLAEKENQNGARDALEGATVEVYNNTTNREEFSIDYLNRPEFKIVLLKGNHYTILIRKMGFLAKRLEAYVDVAGCILCFEGVQDIRPSLSDNLTADNENGTLLANIEMERLLNGKVLAFDNIYYDYNETVLSAKSKMELDKIALFLRDNPGINLEIASHTDAKGSRETNLNLSQKRAESVKTYLSKTKGIAEYRLIAKGYGESLILNKCKDGVECSEGEHDLNRRTEFKVNKIDSNVLIKSLRDIKVDEMMEDLINELSSTQIRIGENGKPVKTGAETKDSAIMNEAYDTTSTQGTQNRPTTYSEHNSEIPESKSDNTLSTAKDPKIKVLQKDYTGFKIVIKFSRYPLGSDHPELADHDEIFHFITADRNHLYLIGHFSSRRSAEAYRKAKVLDKYPNAYVAGYEKGIRVY